MFMSNSRINTRVSNRGDITTTTVNNPSGLEVNIESGRFGKEGTTATIGFEDAPNRRIKLDGYTTRALFESLAKHYGEFIYNE